MKRAWISCLQLVDVWGRHGSGPGGRGVWSQVTAEQRSAGAEKHTQLLPQFGKNPPLLLMNWSRNINAHLEKMVQKSKWKTQCKAVVSTAEGMVSAARQKSVLSIHHLFSVKPLRYHSASFLVSVTCGWQIPSLAGCFEDPHQQTWGIWHMARLYTLLWKCAMCHTASKCWGFSLCSGRESRFCKGCGKNRVARAREAGLTDGEVKTQDDQLHFNCRK